MKPPIRVLELRSVRGTGGGPEKTILLGAARTDPTQFAVTVCYIRDERDRVFSIDARASALPVDYVELTEQHSFDLGIWKSLRRIVRDRAIDIVHAHEYKTDLLAWLLAHFTSVIALATVHGWTGHSSRERRLYYPADKRVLARFPKLIAVSSDIRRELVRNGAHPDRISTIINGIDHRAFVRDRSRQAVVRRTLALGADSFVIGSVGRLEPQKRFDLLIDAFKVCYARQPNLRLLIVGDGSLRQPLTEQIDRAGLSPACTLLGQRTDIADLHHAFDLFVQSSDYEGTPNAVLEAMAMETPVVATDAGGTADILRHDVDGVVVVRGSVLALSSAIERVVSDAAATAARAAAARRRTETDLSFDARMNAIETIYAELFRQRAEPRQARPMTARA